MEPPPDVCPACGSAHEPRQEYCLECGARLTRRSGVVHALGSAWRRRLRWYPGDWIWPSMLALVIAAAGAASAVFATGGSASSAPQTLVATTSPQPPPPTTAPPPAPATTAPPQPTLPPAPKPAPKPHLIRWPGTNGYTVVLASETTRAAAAAKAQTALGQGLPKVGLLVSARYSSLHPGYYVVFSGVYGTLAEAQSAASAAAKRYPSAYARQITR